MTALQKSTWKNSWIQPTCHDSRSLFFQTQLPFTRKVFNTFSQEICVRTPKNPKDFEVLKYPPGLSENGEQIYKRSNIIKNQLCWETKIYGTYAYAKDIRKPYDINLIVTNLMGLLCYKLYHEIKSKPISYEFTDIEISYYNESKVWITMTLTSINTPKLNTFNINSNYLMNLNVSNTREGIYKIELYGQNDSDNCNINFNLYWSDNLMDQRRASFVFSSKREIKSFKQIPQFYNLYSGDYENPFKQVSHNITNREPRVSVLHTANTIYHRILNSSLYLITACPLECEKHEDGIIIVFNNRIIDNDLSRTLKLEIYNNNVMTNRFQFQKASLGYSLESSNELYSKYPKWILKVEILHQTLGSSEWVFETINIELSFEKFRENKLSDLLSYIVIILLCGIIIVSFSSVLIIGSISYVRGNQEKYY